MTQQSEVLSAALAATAISPSELWLSYFALGGNATPAELASILDGGLVPANTEYDVIAQALNDHFVGLGLDHPVPYAEDLLQSAVRPPMFGEGEAQARR